MNVIDYFPVSLDTQPMLQQSLILACDCTLHEDFLLVSLTHTLIALV